MRPLTVGCPHFSPPTVPCFAFGCARRFGVPDRRRCWGGLVSASGVCGGRVASRVASRAGVHPGIHRVSGPRRGRPGTAPTTATTGTCRTEAERRQVSPNVESEMPILSRSPRSTADPWAVTRRKTTPTVHSNTPRDWHNQPPECGSRPTPRTPLPLDVAAFVACTAGKLLREGGPSFSFSSSSRSPMIDTSANTSKYRRSNQSTSQAKAGSMDT